MNNELLPPDQPSIATATESDNGHAPAPPTKQQHKPVASYLHTAVVIALMVGVAVMSATTIKNGTGPKGPFAEYVATIIWLWLLVALVGVGVHKHGVSVRELIGTPWKSFDDVLIDLAIAGGFWFASVLLLAGLKFIINPGLLHAASSPNGVQESLKSIAPLIPHTSREIFFWILMSLSAGFCEEFVFRGYLQKQFSALAKNAALGIIFSAVIFGIGHLYQGKLQMALIGAYGAMFGILAHFRKSLRPGMIAHAWQDILSGLVASMLLQHATK
ncbi:MAG: Abortive infection protein [Acidobacteriales bacterium]|nr:Abortive infection protein [Terriglobales bacterium]